MHTPVMETYGNFLPRHIQKYKQFKTEILVNYIQELSFFHAKIKGFLNIFDLIKFYSVEAKYLIVILKLPIEELHFHFNSSS
jgi:hypothetical protein